MAAPTLDATAKGASANSYVTEASAQTYFDGRLNVAEWTAAVVAAVGDQDRALIQATNRLELETYVSLPTTDTQRLQWPRATVVDPWGNFYDPDTIPRPVAEATYELALAYLKSEVDLSEVGLEAFENVKVGSLDVTPRVTRRGDALPSVVRRLLLDIRTSGSEINLPVAKS